jgi:hypothetical protein
LRTFTGGFLVSDENQRLLLPRLGYCLGFALVDTLVILQQLTIPFI